MLSASRAEERRPNSKFERLYIKRYYDNRFEPEGQLVFCKEYHWWFQAAREVGWSFVSLGRSLLSFGLYLVERVQNVSRAQLFWLVVALLYFLRIFG